MVVVGLLFLNVICTLVSLDVLRHFEFSNTLTRLRMNREHIDSVDIRMTHDNGDNGRSCPCSTVTIRLSIWTAALYGDAARVHYLLYVSKRM